MIQLRTLLFFLGWFTYTGILGILGLPLLLSRRLTWWAARIWAGGTLHWLRLCCGIESHLVGSEHLKGARIVASKHQSAWDTLMLWYLLGHPVFVLKRSLYSIPVFGWYLWRSGQIGIDRNKKNGTIAMIAARAAKHQESGRTLVIFPEGTRVPPAQRKPFHAGVAYISAELGIPVVPVALNAGLFWPRGSLLKRPGRAVLHALPAVPACGKDTKAWLAKLESVINIETEKLTSAAVQLPVA